MKTVTLDQASRGIYLDFESLAVARPVILGVACSSSELADGELLWIQYVVDESLWPAAALCDADGGHFSHAAELGDALDAIRQLATAEDRILFAYSEHDLKVIKRYLDGGADTVWWEQHLVNARPIAKRWKTLNHPTVVFPPEPGKTTESHTLANYLDLIGYEVPPEYGRGVAAHGMRAVAQELEDPNLTEVSSEASSAWANMLQHNWHDCHGMRELMVNSAD